MRKDGVLLYRKVEGTDSNHVHFDGAENEAGCLQREETIQNKRDAHILRDKAPVLGARSETLPLDPKGASRGLLLDARENVLHHGQTFPL